MLNKEIVAYFKAGRATLPGIRMEGMENTTKALRQVVTRRKFDSGSFRYNSIERLRYTILLVRSLSRWMCASPVLRAGGGGGCRSPPVHVFRIQSLTYLLKDHLTTLHQVMDITEHRIWCEREYERWTGTDDGWSGPGLSRYRCAIQASSVILVLSSLKGLLKTRH
jgi:hypothetical protein